MASWTEEGFGKTLVHAASAFVDIERAMETVEPDHTEPQSLWKWRDRLLRNVDRAIGDLIIDAHDLCRAAEAKKEATC